MPVGKPGRRSGTGYSVTLAVWGSSLPRNCSPKLENHTVPAESTTTSCGSIVFRGRSYSVKMTRVDGPVGRGSVLSEYDHVGPELRLMLARYFARSSVPAPNRRADLHRLRAVEIVPDRPNPDGIASRRHLRRREAVTTLLAADDGDRDGGSFLPGAHQDAFHRAVFDRAHLPGEGDPVGACGA